MAAIVVVSLLLLITFAHVVGVVRLLILLRQPISTLEPERWPRVAVLIGLRGADPYLAQSLRQILAQDYPDYQVHFVVDSQEDAAWDVVGSAIEETAANHGHRVEFLDRPEDGIVNCTTSKQVQALRTLGDDIEIVAMADGDLVPHATWLKELVRPMLADETIGATFGERWFVPKQGRWGSLTRAVWNQMAVFQAVMLNLPWGGCFAIRADAIKRGNLIDEWSRSLAFDAAAPHQLKQQGLRVAFVPNLLMPNAEECSIPFCINWVRRQLTWVKLYHNNFWAVAAQTGLMTLLQLLCGLLLIWAAWRDDRIVLLLSALALLCHFSTLHVLSMVLNLRVARIMSRNTGAAVRLTKVQLLKLFVAVPLSQYVQRVAVCQALFQRQVTWRGLTLEVIGPHDIRVVDNDESLKRGAKSDESL